MTRLKTLGVEVLVVSHLVLRGEAAWVYSLCIWIVLTSRDYFEL